MTAICLQRCHARTFLIAAEQPIGARRGSRERTHKRPHAHLRDSMIAFETAIVLVIVHFLDPSYLFGSYLKAMWQPNPAIWAPNSFFASIQR